MLNRKTRSLPGGYCLELDREFDLYRVQDCSRRRNVNEGVGVLQGSIQELGWNASTIVALRKSCCGNGDGFMIIDIASDRIDGPFPREVMERRLGVDAGMRGITIRPVRDYLR